LVEDGVMQPRDYREYSAEGALIAGGGAAILLQLGDPVVAAGVAAHSDFSSEPMRRLRHTLAYVYAIGLGDPGHAAGAARTVNRAHAPVPGAFDPDHQLWVAATLYAVGMRMHTLLFGRMPAQLADEVYARSAQLGTALQLPPELWPPDRAAFALYWKDAVARLEVTDEARDVAERLLNPVAAPFWLRLAMPLGRVVTAGLLPASVRVAYGLPDEPRKFRTAIRVLRVLARITPRRVRALPSRLLGPQRG
jgi:uncharacterized protein (DUF2236 family)